MTVKFDNFIAELRELCIKHEVTIGSSLYDSPAVWDRDGDEEPLEHINDRTREIE